MSDPIVRHGWYWSFGWIRRAEYDTDDMYCYEEPCGELWLSLRNAIYLDCRRCMKTGGLYCSPSFIPKRPMTYDPSTKSSSSRRNAKG